MDIKEYITLLYKKKGLILSFLVVFFTVSAVFTALQPFNYLAKTRLIVVQNFDKQMDPYSIAKANQYTSVVLVNIISSSSFYDSVIDSKFNINKDYFADSAKSETEKWNEVVSTGAIDDTGIITVQVLHAEKYQAEEIARAVMKILNERYRDYYKAMQDIEIKVLDKVSVSNFPVKPNVAMNLILGMVFGIVSSFCYIYIFAEKIQKELDKNKEIRHKNEESRRKNKELKIKNKKVRIKNKELRAKSKNVGNKKQELRIKKSEDIRHKNKRMRIKNKELRIKNKKEAKNSGVKNEMKGNIKNLFG
jgi:capsular polysaccharide biosynthesis protein